MKALLNKAHYPVTTLGPGVRAGIWFQGCTLACDGCLSKDTWEADPATAVDIATLLGWLRSLPKVEGVTISGGEPFQQPEALAALLTAIDDWRTVAGRDIDVLVYSGYAEPALRRRHPSIVAQCDAIIAGPYVQRRNHGDHWRGSDNQTLMLNTELGRARLGDIAAEPGGELQVSVVDDRVYYIGIPRAGDLATTVDALADAGISGRVSWRS